MKAVINGKETELTFDFGTVRLFNRSSGLEFMRLREKDFAEAETIAHLLYAVAARKNKEITIDDIDELTFPEITDLSDKMRQLMDEYFPKPGEVEKAGPLDHQKKKSKPQS